MKIYQDVACIILYSVIVEFCVGTRYAVYPECKSWFEAVVLCQEKGGNLAIIPDAVTHNHVVSLIHQGGHNDVNFWINAHDTNSEGHWTTTNGDPIPYQNWAEGEPNNYGGHARCGGYQDCTQLWSERDNFEWDDEICCQSNGYVCEFLDHTTTTEKAYNNKTTISAVVVTATHSVTETTQQTTEPVTTTMEQCRQMLSISPATVTSSSNNSKPKARQYTDDTDSDDTKSSSDPFIIILLILSVVNFTFLVCITAFLYVCVWKKLPQAMVREPRYQDLVNQSSGSDMFLTDVQK
ncbi:uncharacterized protein LOC144436659 isoform X2 [Glandiceps talaboti]